ncbi:MAG: hypothetical protein WCI17_01120 [bacterium]
MRRTFIRIGILAFALAGTAAAAGDLLPVPAKKKVKPAPVEHIDPATLMSKTTWKGSLAAAPTNAAATVVGVLKPEKHVPIAPLLLRTGDPVLAARVQEMVATHKGAAVVLTARLDPDGTSLLVTDVLLLPRERKPERP